MKASRYEGTTGEFGSFEGSDFPYSRATSEPTIHTSDRIIKVPRIRRNTTGDITDHRVHWSDKSKVILVPSRQDYSNRGFKEDLWWEPKDYDEFKVSAKEEVLNEMHTRDVDFVTAMTDLYQPGHDHSPEKCIETPLGSKDSFEEQATTEPLPSPAMLKINRGIGSHDRLEGLESIAKAEKFPINFLDVRSEKGESEKTIDIR